jgi:hypothetical protein
VLVNLIRTYVPVAIGALIAWLATLGVSIDNATSAGFVAGLTGLATALYYTLVRVAESRWPKLGVLLGVPRAPSNPVPASDAGDTTSLA